MVESVEMEISEAKVGDFLKVRCGTTGLKNDSGQGCRTFLEIENDVEERPPIPPDAKVRQFNFDRGPRSRTFIELAAPKCGENILFQVAKGGRSLQIALAGDDSGRTDKAD
jgi:hypothetical protein